MNQQVNFHEIHIFQLELDNKDNSLPDKTKAQPLPTGTTIPTTIPYSPHYDHYHGIKPLIRTNTCTVGNCPGGVGSCPDTILE